MTDDSIVAHDVSLAHHGERRLVVRGVSFAARPFLPVTVLGPAGAGKSTLLAAVAARDPAEGGPELQGGDVVTLGTPLRTIGARARTRLQTHIGYVPQLGSERLPGIGTVADAVAEPIFERDPRFDRAEAGAQVAAVVDRMRLPLGFLSRPVYELSRGQRQRVALARAIVLDPRALVVDDPVSGLDPVIAPGILEVLRDLAASITVVAAVRSPRQARTIGGTAIVLHRGATIGIGPIDEQLADPRHEFVAALARTEA